MEKRPKGVEDEGQRMRGRKRNEALMEFVKLDNDEERKERKQLMMAKEMTQHCNSLQLRYSAPAASFMKNKAK